MTDELEHDVDPANGTVPHFEDPSGSARFTSPEKIVNVAREIMARPSADARVGTLLAVLMSPFGRRLVLNPLLALLPPLDAPDEWDEWLCLLTGCALELVSDGIEVDVDACRRQAGVLLAQLFEGSPG